MVAPRRPVDETQRLQALHEFDLDTLPEQALDDLAVLAAHICDAPIALISLVDAERQWFKSKVGLSISETSRDVSLCAHAILQAAPLVVPDAAADERFARSPLVTGEPAIRFYAGVPLVTTGGHALGTLCVMDRVPRQLNAGQLGNLRILSRQVMAHFELRRRTRALAESEARLLTIFRNCPVGLAIHRWSDRTFVDVNAAFTSLLGWSHEDLVGRTASDLNIVDEAAAATLRQQLQATGKVRAAEVAVRRRDGRLCHVVMGSEIVELRGERHALTTFIDVEERWQAEQSLRDSEERLRLALDAAHMGTFDWDIPGGRITWARWHHELWGYAPGEFDGTYDAFAARVHPDDRASVNDEVARCIASRQPFTHEFRVVWPDGSIRWIAGRGEFSRDGDGRPLRMRGAVVDITTRKEAEAALGASEARYRTLFQYAPDGIVVADHEGYYRDVNDSFLRMTGYTRHDALRLRGSDLLAEHAVSGFEAGLAEIVATGDYQQEWPLRRKDGSIFDAEVRATIMPDGKLLAIIRDATTRKQDELRIQHLNRTYAVLSKVNEAIVRERQPRAMLAAACRIAVDTGQFRMAWIGLTDPHSARPQIVAHAGATDAVLGLVRALVDDDGQGNRCAMTTEALRRGTNQVSNDIAADPRSLAWRDAALQHNYRAMASLPLKADGLVVGVFNLYADTPGTFDVEELRLLNELAMDIGFALEIGRREEERKAADERHARQRNALIGLTARRTLYERDLAAALEEITETAARTLQVARVGIWRYNADRSAITCVDLFELDTKRHTSGATLAAASYPAYFRALAEVEVIAATDAVTDPRTCEFRDDYLAAIGIGSMLDVPIHVRGGREGVLCHEHVGAAREWTADDKTYAVAMANLVSLTLESWERRQAERAMRDSEERFREIAENIQEAFWMTDAATNEVLYVSPVYERIWGRSRASLYESPLGWLEAIHPDDRARIGHALQARGAGVGYDETYRILQPDGSIRWIHDRAFPVRSASGEASRVVGAAEDITERRKLEEQFRQSQKMEAIGQLAGGVAHDFNNLLTVIHGYASFQLETAASSQQAGDLKQIVLAAERASGLTRQLLAFSRRQVMQTQVIDLNQAVTSITAMLQRVLGEDLRLRLTLASRPLMTRADPGMIDQVLMNLAVNARDAMPNGGQLTIETAAVTLTDEQARAIQDARTGSYVCLRVSDTGAGMAPETLARIFEPFFTTKGPGKGTGLGLATVFGIVRQHDGAITVASEEHKGTAFDILLPAIVGDQQTTASDVVTAPTQRGTETILLVEDEEGVRMLARVVLERQGYKVLEASHGVEALRLWDEAGGSIALVVTDMVMPEGINGRDLAARIQASRPEVRVIFTSGYSADVAGRELSLQQGQNFIQKPYSPPQLLEIVRRTLDS